MFWEAQYSRCLKGRLNVTVRAGPVVAGRSAYALADNGVMAFDLGRGGQLLPKPGSWGCIGLGVPPCVSARGVRNVDSLVASSDGRYLYAGSYSNSIAVLTRKR